MALVVKDRVKETTATTGTGTLTLAGAVAGFQTFTSVLSNGDTTYYGIFDSVTGAFEVGLGTFTSSGTTLARTTILESSNSGSAVSLGAGSKDVFITYPAEKSLFLDASDNLAAVDITALSIGGTAISSTAAELNYNDTGAAVGTVVASKTVTVDANKDVSSFRNVTASGAITGNTFVIGAADINENDLEAIDGITAGTVLASKAMVVDTNKDITGARNITLTGELDAGSLDISGNADIDGTLEADAITINGTAIGSIYSVIAGSSSIVTTGALNSGSITSGFGAINNGSSNITTTGVGTFASLDISGSVDVDGTLEADAITLNGTALGSIYSPIAGSGSITTTGAINSGSITSGFGTINNGASAITTTGVGTFASLDISGSVDVDGTLEADAITLNGTALGSIYSPIAGSGSITTTGAINSGSINTGFGTINNGASAITTTGVGTFGSLDISGSVDVDGTMEADAITLNGTALGSLYLGISAKAADSQLLDGVDGANYLRSNTSDTFTGTLTLTGSMNASAIVFAESLQEDYDALSGTSPAPDADNAGYFSLSTSGNTTFSFGGVTSGRAVGFLLSVTAGGAHTLTWPSTVDWPGGAAPDAPASGASNLYAFVTRDGGTNWIGVLSAAAYA